MCRVPEAIGHYEQALRVEPQYAEARNNLGNALALTGRVGEAIEQYREAIRLRPGWKVPQKNLELLLAQKAAPDLRGRTRQNSVQ